MRIIVERFELPEPEPPAEFSYVYDNTYIFYFSTDINEFLNKEENRPHLEALTETLDYADKIISDFVEATKKNDDSIKTGCCIDKVQQPILLPSSYTPTVSYPSRCGRLE